MRKKRRSIEWFVIIGIAVLVHLALFLYFRPEFFAPFKRSLRSSSVDASQFASSPDAVLIIPIEIEDSDEPPPPKDPTDDPSTETPRKNLDRQPANGDTSSTSFDLETVIGESTQPLPFRPAPDAVVIPPRPLEITWPDTRRLKHCLGHQIDVRIQVDEDGEILRVEAQNGTHPPDCVQAAIDSAARILFEPGKINGHPAKMWTQVRIDFKKKKS